MIHNVFVPLFFPAVWLILFIVFILATHLLLLLLMKCKHWQWCDLTVTLSSDRDAAICVKYDIIKVWLTDGLVERKTNDYGRPDLCDRHVHCTVNMQWQENLCAYPHEDVFLSRFNTWRAAECEWKWEISWIKFFSSCRYIYILLFKNVSNPPPFLVCRCTVVWKSTCIYFLLTFSLSRSLFPASGRYRQL